MREGFFCAASVCRYILLGRSLLPKKSSKKKIYIYVSSMQVSILQKRAKQMMVLLMAEILDQFIGSFSHYF